MTKLSFIDKILVTKNSFKHVQCSYQVSMRVHVGEREMLWEQKPTGLFPQLFLVLPNSHDYFYNSIAARIALQTIFIYAYRLHADGGSCVTTWRQFLFSFFTRTFSVTGMAAIFNFHIPFFDMLCKLVYVNHVSRTGFFTVEFDFYS